MAASWKEMQGSSLLNTAPVTPASPSTGKTSSKPRKPGLLSAVGSVSRLAAGQQIRKDAPDDDIERLQESRFQLQKRGIDAQIQELKFLQQQQSEQRKLDDISLGMMRQQIDAAQQNSAIYAQQLSLLGEAQQEQMANAQRQNEYTSLLEREQNRMAAGRSNFNRRLVQRRRAVRAQSYSSGVLTSSERRAV